VAVRTGTDRAPADRPRSPGPRRALAALGLAAVVAVALALPACGQDTTVDGEAAPGFDDRERPVDTSPFAMANPTTTEGGTTIPGPGPTLYRPTTTNPQTGESAQVGELPPSVEAAIGPRNQPAANGGGGGGRERRPRWTLPPTTLPPPIPTTTLPGGLVLADPATITSLCGMVDTITSIRLLFIDPSLPVEPTIVRLQENMERYVAVSPPERRADVIGLRDSIAIIAGQMRAAGWRTDDPAVQGSAIAIQNATPPFQDFNNQGTRVLFHERATCPR
jgi:hypothetical protein